MSLSSLNEKRIEQEARELSKHTATDWSDYDFSETEKDLERRVPKIYFSGISDIEVKAKNPEHVEGFSYEKFIRRYEVTYKDKHFLFVITVDSHWNCVKKFLLTVYSILDECAGEKEPQQVMLFTESL